jgi:hypothetical protein
MRTVFAATLMAALAAGPGARADEIERIDILEFGIYTATLERTENADTAAGVVNIMTNVKLVRRTDAVTARLGVRFGIEYMLVGKPAGELAVIDWVTRFPERGLTNAKGERFQKNELSRTTPIGERTHRTYTFDEAWELVPGKWVLEFYHRGRKLGEKSFTVVLP